MCRKDTIIHIDSRHRNSDSTSSSDITIDLDHPLQIYDSDGLQVKSIHIPNTLKTVNTGVNNVLHTKLGIVDLLN